MKLIFECREPEELAEAAEILTSYFRTERIFAFYGEMGAGKTTFIRAICKELGSRDQVNSPTYGLVNEYLIPGNRSIYHFDFYRILEEEEAIDIGFDDYVHHSGFCLIEWPEKVNSLLPKRFVKVTMELIGQVRRISMEIVG